AASFFKTDLKGRLTQAVFELGDAFVYEQTEPPDRILFLARLPMIALALVLGFLLHRWTQALWGARAALIALALYVSSSFMLAHGFAAALGVSALVISLVYAFHVWNYPADQHVQDMIDVLSAERGNVYARFAWLPALARWRPLRPLAHYLFGVVWQRYRSGAF